MRISRTGPPDRERGFTLIELLVVLTIFGLISTVVVLAMPDPRGSLVGEAERFAARAKAVQDKAIIDARATSIRVTGAGYAFDERARGEWQPMRGIPRVQIPWPEGMQALVPDGEVQRIVFDSTGIAEPAEVTLQRGEEQVAVTIAHDGTIDVVR